jgi:diguanylate cyclase (GGDEF)-like protein
MELRGTLTRNHQADSQVRQPLLEQTSLLLSSAQVELRAGLGWVFELGITPDLPLHHRKNLAMINRVTFTSLLLALPGTFLLILMDFTHPFSLLLCGVVTASLVLTLNGVRRIGWAELLFAYTPAVFIVIFTMLKLNASGSTNTLTYILSRQGLCLGLLLPVLVFGFEERQKVIGVLGSCMLIFLFFEVTSMQNGAFQAVSLSGISHGLFSIFSLLQYLGLAGCVLYVQHYSLMQAQQAQQTNQKLHHMAMRDGLTGIFNRAFMEQLISDAINRSRRSNTPLSLLMIDIDSFKQVNDSWGHQAGDAALKALVGLLRSNKRSTDYLSRWGGDELLILLTDTDLAGAANLAEKLRRLVGEASFPHHQQLTISLGASSYQEGDSPASFIARADAAMYRAKRGGRNRVEVQKQ